MNSTLASLVVRVLGDTSHFVRAFTAADSVVNKSAANLLKSGQAMSRVGSTMTRTITLPIVALGAFALKTASDYEKAMNTMAQVADVPAAGMMELDALAKKLGRDTIFSTQEAADAMLELAKGGLSVAQIKAGALATTLDLAAAADMELAESAVILSSAMNTFQLEGSQAGEVADALAGAANASSAGMNDMAYALQAGGSSAARFGMTVQETAAVLALLADNGIRGSDAGTLLKSQLRTLVPVSEKAASKMKELGLDFFDAQGNFIGLAGMSNELKKELGGLTQEQRELAIAQLFGSDASRLAGILAREGAAGLKEYMAATTEAGAASDTAAAKMKGLPGVIEQLKGSAETALLVIGQRMTPAFSVLAKGATLLINTFTLFPKPLQSIFVAFLALAAATGPVLYGWGKMKIGAAHLLGPLLNFRKALIAAAAAETAAGVSTTGLVAKLRLLWTTIIQSSVVQTAISPIVGLSNALQGLGLSAFAAAAAIAVVAAAVVAAVIIWREAEKAQKAEHDALMSNIDIMKAYAEATAAGKHSAEDLANQVKLQIRNAKEAGANQEELNAIQTAGTKVLHDYNASQKMVVKEGGKYVTMTKQGYLATRTFAGMASKEYETWRADTVDNFNVVKGQLDKLATKHNVTANQILAAMQKAMRAQIEFSRNWKDVVDRAGKDGEEFVAWIQENYGAKAPAFVAALANANKQQFDKMIKIWNTAAGHAEITSQKTGNALYHIPDSAKRAAGNTKSELSKIPTAVSAQQGPSRAAANAVGNSIVDGMKAPIEARGHQVATETANMVHNAITAGKEAAESGSPSRKMMELGSDMVAGTTLGISRNERQAINATGKMVKGLVQEAKKILGISSPSKVFFHMGKESVAGYIQGLQRTQNKLENTLDRLMDRINEKMAGKLRQQRMNVARQLMQMVQVAGRQLDKAIDKMDELRSQVEDFRSVVQGGFDDFGNVLDSFNEVVDSSQASIDDARQAVDDAKSAYEDAQDTLKNATFTDEVSRLTKELEGLRAERESIAAAAKDAIETIEDSPTAGIDKRITDLEEDIASAKETAVNQEIESMRDAVSATKAAKEAAEQLLRGLETSQKKDVLAGFLDALTDQEKDAKAFGSMLRELGEKGLNRQTLEQIASSGEAGLALGKAILDGGDNVIRDINGLVTTIKDQQLKTADALTETYFKDNLAAASAKLVESQKRLAELNEEVNRFGNQIDIDIKMIDNAAKILEAGAKKGDTEIRNMALAASNAASLDLPNFQIQISKTAQKSAHAGKELDNVANSSNRASRALDKLGTTAGASRSSEISRNRTDGGGGTTEIKIDRVILPNVKDGPGFVEWMDEFTQTARKGG